MVADCFLVIGVPRSGTSLVSGILHHFGVFMGDRLMKPGPLNPKGFFHDMDFEKAMRLRDGSITSLIRTRESLGKPWGVNTRLTIDFLDMFPSPKILKTRRPLEASKASWRRLISEVGPEFIEDLFALHEKKLCGRDFLEIDYDICVDNPRESLNRIAKFVNLPVSEAALDFVDPSMRHHVG